MDQEPTFHTIKRYIFLDFTYGVFFESAIDIYKNGVFFHRIPERHKDILIKVLKYGKICKENNYGA